MEHSISASSGAYHMYKDHPLLMCTTTAEVPHKSKPSFRHSNLHSNSMCAPASHDARPASQVHPGRMPIEPLRSEGCDTHVSSSHNKPDASSSLHEPSVVHDNSSDETLQAHMMPPGAPLAQYNNSPEALLDVILVAQKKLQQLKAIVELLVQADGQSHEQQQSLVACMKSIMSQLYVATAGFCGQSATCLKQNLEPASKALDQGSIAQLSQALDLSFDDFHSNDLNTFILSQLAAPNEGFFPISSILTCSESTQSTMELNVRLRSAQAPMGLDVTRSATELAHTRGPKDPQLKKQGLIFSVPGNQVTNHLQHSNTRNTLVENELSNETVVETCDTYGNRNHELMFSLEDPDYASVLRDDDEDDVEGENLPPGSYELVEMAAAEILAEHTHFCEICGKGFKRDANLRMHMRGHGDEYKTPAALARPLLDKGLHTHSCNKLRRYSCPYVGCKRNKKHRKFQPLKTTLCVKNHYRRSHCPKLLICSKCKTKKFSVVADLKTHEKHCGQDKWQCSCGTTFSRKDKLVGHVSLFVGHTPAVPMHETEGLNEPAAARDQGDGLLEGLSTSKPSYDEKL